MIEKWRASLDQNGTYAALLIDLSKAFDSLRHDLLIAKLHAYGRDLQSLKLLKSYLGRRHDIIDVFITAPLLFISSCPIYLYQSL